jgi:enoyl-CoA hydratase/carnithine racemase
VRNAPDRFEVVARCHPDGGHTGGDRYAFSLDERADADRIEVGPGQHDLRADQQSLRYAQSGARFSLREVRLAIVADLGGLARLPAIVGEGHARELALTGADIDAEHAARSIAVHAPLTVAGIKNVMNAQQGKSIADGLQYVAAWNAAFLQSEDFARAAAAFRRST